MEIIRTWHNYVTQPN